MSRDASITPFDFFLFRIPALPIKDFLELNHCLSLHPENQAFKALLTTSPIFLQALYTASPPLYERVLQWLAGSRVSEEPALIKTLYKYFSRICSRSTPYGLFAGVSLAVWQNNETIRSESESDVLHIEPSLAYLNTIIRKILSNRPLRQQLRYFSNNSAYRTGQQLRYIEPVLQDNRPAYFLSSLAGSAAIDTILSMAQNGCSYHAIKKILLPLSASPDDADAFIDELINFQLLQSELELKVTDEHPADSLLTPLLQLREIPDIANALREIRQLVNAGNASFASCRQMAALLNQTGIDPGKNLPLHITLQRGGIHVKSNRQTIRKITDQLTDLMALNRTPRTPFLARFKEMFYRKYEEAEIPLAIALDGELGIGYGDSAPDNPFINNLLQTTPVDPVTTLGSWDNFLLTKYLEAHSRGLTDLVITESDLAQFRVPVQPPPSFYALGSLLGVPQNGRDDFRFHLAFCGGSSAINLMARFASPSESLKEKLREIVREEERLHPDVLFAEVIHLPDSAVSNALVHPPFREYEIPYLTASGAPGQHQIPLHDLVISVPHGRKILLRSVKHNRKVVPRLSNAHRYTSGPPVYHFLCDLQHEDSALNLYWDWSFLSDRPFLPRVTYKNIILKRATWNLTGKDVAALDAFRLQYGLPRYVQLIENDNELLLDLANTLSLEILQKALPKTGPLCLTEFLQLPGRTVASDGKNDFCSEVIIPFSNTSVSRNTTVLPEKPVVRVQREFCTGSAWLYLKIYCGQKFADTLLLQTLQPCIERLAAKGIIEKWFFVRFRDPDPHLRLRLYNGTRNDFYPHVLQDINQVLAPYLEELLIDRVSTDTYKRELERYGADAIEQVESIFHYDSRMVLALLATLKAENLDEYRWLLALRITDLLLDCFGMCPDEKTGFSQEMYRHYFDEHDGNTDLAVRLNNNYRDCRTAIHGFFEQGTLDGVPMDAVLQQLDEYSAQVSICIADAPRSFTRPQIAAVIHLFFNRLFTENQRTFELANYHFLTRYYKGEAAKAARNSRFVGTK